MLTDFSPGPWRLKMAPAVLDVLVLLSLGPVVLVRTSAPMRFLFLWEMPYRESGVIYAYPSEGPEVCRKGTALTRCRGGSRPESSA